jgi:transposase
VRYELSDRERSVIRVMLPTKSRGKRRVDDRRVLNGIFWRSSSWRQSAFAPYFMSARPSLRRTGSNPFRVNNNPPGQLERQIENLAFK